MSMVASDVSATARAFATPELLEHILACLLDDILPPSPQEDPRSVRTHTSARKLLHLLRCSEVNHFWQGCMRGSACLQRALFLLPDNVSDRSWQHDERGSSDTAQTMRTSHRHTASSETPVLNSILQVTFKSYHFRFWHLSLEASDNKHCAYLIVTRRDLPALEQRAVTGQGRMISNMLLSQPPCAALEATIWEERDETKDYLGRTTSLRDPFIRHDEGLTIGMVHDKVGEMFREHSDVAAIKLTTV
ncbi:hypothetical protein B0A50_06966 [Salinomyces thailandicus]|uniref:F-box domain-containing protein n=1 Tax=Salinomyces thailandicus TaxID=706561 RepID=A0A4U0TP45_9PEZI|nr:hypothetical protein B0A50_06966 [Salinomyces thailandica]